MERSKTVRERCTTFTNLYCATKPFLQERFKRGHLGVGVFCFHRDPVAIKAEDKLPMRHHEGTTSEIIL